MLNRTLYASSVFISVLIFGLLVSRFLSKGSCYNMPLVEDDPFATSVYGGDPVEQRDANYRKWLSVGVKIRVGRIAGSGTIVYYSTRDQWAYVQSCGHLWDENNINDECKIITWYHNEVKLSEPETYVAEVLYRQHSRGRDISLLRFKANWKPDYFPVAPENWNYEEGQRLHSIGCDGGREIAHYDVEVVGVREGEWPDLVTTRNSPRPGRSGGGLLSENYFVGICWGTSDFSGTGNGYFIPLSTVREYNRRNGYEWLNNVSHNSLARRIPIIDRNSSQGHYSIDYIPLPQF